MNTNQLEAQIKHLESRILELEAKLNPETPKKVIEAEQYLILCSTDFELMNSDIEKYEKCREIVNNFFIFGY